MTAEEAAATSYVRSRNGQTVHRSGCKVVERIAFPWEWKWAEGKDVYEILSELGGHGIRYTFCQRCFPELTP